MCGHVGVLIHPEEIKDIDSKLRKWMDQALLVGDLRGGDGTGMMSLSLKSTYVIKRGMTGADFRELKDVYTRLSDMKCLYFLAHHRKATIGELSDENSHPFTYGKVTMFHNGTLTPCVESRKFTVDSQMIASKLGAAELYKDTKVLEGVNGAYSLVWYDGRTDEIKFARNNERPMFFGYVGKSLVYASEKGMIEWLCSRNSLVLTKIKETEPGIMYSFNPYLEVIESKFTPYENPYYSKYEGFYKSGKAGSYVKDPINGWQWDDGTKKNNVIYKKGAEVATVAPSKTVIKGLLQKTVSKSNIEVSGECDYCGDSVAKLYEASGGYVCPMCLSVLNSNSLCSI